MECENVSLQLIAELFFVTSPRMFLCMQHNSAVAYEILFLLFFTITTEPKKTPQKARHGTIEVKQRKKTRASRIQDKFPAKKEKQLMMNDNAFSLVAPSLCSPLFYLLNDGMSKNRNPKYKHP